MAKKAYTSERKAQTAQERAVRYTADVLGDADRAEEIADMSLSEWLESTGRRIENPKFQKEKNVMPVSKGPTKDELLDENEQLRSENETLRDLVDEYSERLDHINAITVKKSEEEEEFEDVEDEGEDPETDG